MFLGNSFLQFQEVKKGEIDFLIATHAVFSPSLSFKNLGLLVLDEEVQTPKPMEVLVKKRAFEKSIWILRTYKGGKPAGGMGFFVGKKHFVTNFHVIFDPNQIKSDKIT